VKTLIVTGDDFGLSASVNAGILTACREGILRGTSLMVAGAARDEAVARARDYPELDVGLHLVVCRGASVLPPARLGGVVDSAGRFRRQPALTGMRYFFDRKIRTALRAECEAQFEEHLRLISRLDHVDGHLNFHVHPVLADIVVEMAARYQVPFVRLPREPIMTTLELARDHVPRKLLEAVIFRLLSGRTRRLMSEKGIQSADWLFGLHQSGNLSERYLIGVIERLRDGVTEIYFHPASDGDGGKEVALLTSDAVRGALLRSNVQLINFAQLARESRKSSSGKIS
jgi:hopanoid biosynthesis associated protein HpnK